MLKICDNLDDIIFILENLREEDKEELNALWGDDWFNLTLDNLKDKKNILILTGKDGNKNIVPIAMGGFYELFEKNSDIACVWMLSSYFIKYNRLLLAKYLKMVISKASLKYGIMYNYIYHTNHEAKNWLKKLGFQFNNPHPEGMDTEKGFEFFYKIK